MNSALRTWVYGYANAHTQAAYGRAWRSLLQRCGKESPEQVTADDVQGWIDAMSAAGASARTIRLRLSAISSFFGSTSGNGNNPTSKAIRPNIPVIENPLDDAQLWRLLHCIPQTTVRGLHDYAMFLAYARTGAQVRTWTWGGFRVDRQTVQYRRTQKNGAATWVLCPHDVWIAMTAYLRAAERLDKIGLDDLVFTAGHGPISYQELGRRLNRYGKMAGINCHLRIRDLRTAPARAQRPALALGSLPRRHKRHPRLHGIGRRSI